MDGLMEFGPKHELTRNVADQLRPEECEWFPRAVQALVREDVPFLMAGGFGLYHYTGFWRGTKDIDVLVLPQDREAAIQVIQAVGYRDMYDEEPYDREWIFRGIRNGVIFDIIWQLANKEDDIDRGWFARSVPASFLGAPVQVVSPADLCWMKLFVFQRKRCDWPDIINIIRGTQGNLDWARLLKQVGPHWRLLVALVEIYDWLCPTDRPFIPASFRDALEDLRRRNADRDRACRHDLFDTRPWLTAPGAGHTESVVSSQ